MGTSFLDSADTKTAMEALKDLVTVGNVYLDSKRRGAGGPDRYLLTDMAAYITRILKVRPETATIVHFCFSFFKNNSLLKTQ